MDKYERGNHVGLVSGGLDSTVAAHYAINNGPVDLLVYLDTRTGLDETKDYLHKLADHLGVQLWTLRTHESYKEQVKETGFPGPAQHQTQYTALKERQISRLATLSSGRGNASDLHLWTGVRSDESERRMEHVEPESEGQRWIWHAPIHDWTKEECRKYVDKHDLPENSLWDTLGRSGDCFCGCFGAPSELLDLEAVGCGYHADWIRGLQDKVNLDAKHERQLWAWGAFDESEQKQARANQDEHQLTLCSDCMVSTHE